MSIIARAALHIQIPHIQRVLLNKLPARFDVVAHEDAEEFVGGADVVHADLQQRAVGGVERRFAEFFRVHFAEAFEPGDLQTFFARGADGAGEAAEVFEARFVFAAADGVAAPLFAGPFLRNERLRCRSRGLSGRQHVVDRADFVEFDDAKAGG